MVQQWITSADAAHKWGISVRRVNELCRAKRIEGASKLDDRWIIPADAKMPTDARKSMTASQPNSDVPIAFRHGVGVAPDPSNHLPLPVGVSDYRLLVTKYYYVDKTLLIRDLIDAQDYVTLFCRPRRFGKTLNMDMLRTFFEKTPEDTSRYFQRSAIWGCGEKYRVYQGAYPVISLSFKDVKADSYEGSLAAIARLIQREYDRHTELSCSKALSDVERSHFERIRTGADAVDETSLRESLFLLSALLHAHYGRTVMIMIDDYDTPIEQGYVHGYYDRITAFMNAFLSAALKDNPHLRMGIMTGVLQVAKGDVLGGFNNVQVYTVLDEPYASYFGFTDEEVRAMASYYGTDDAYAELCDWYGGYCFGSTNVFNPWSVICYFRNAQKAQAYWVSSANNQVLRDIIRHADASVVDQLKSLVEGKAVAARVDANVVYPKLSADPSTILSFLLMSGYLKPVESLPAVSDTYLLAIPNKEVSQAFTDEVLSELSSVSESNSVAGAGMGSR